MCFGDFMWLVVGVLAVIGYFAWSIWVTISIKELNEDYCRTRKDYWDLRKEVEGLKGKQKQKKGGIV